MTVVLSNIERASKYLVFLLLQGIAKISKSSMIAACDKSPKKARPPSGLEIGSSTQTSIGEENALVIDPKRASLLLAETAREQVPYVKYIGFPGVNGAVSVPALNP